MILLFFQSSILTSRGETSPEAYLLKKYNQSPYSPEMKNWLIRETVYKSIVKWFILILCLYFSRLTKTTIETSRP